MDAFARVAGALLREHVRYAVIGVWGANYYTRGSLFVTQDQDLFPPGDPENLLRAWRCCEGLGLELRSGNDPLDSPRDVQLAAAVVANRALTTATDNGLLCIDFSLVMTGVSFDAVWSRHRSFTIDGVPVPVASLADIVAAKRAADRPKDRLFLATHAAELRRLLGP